MKLPMSEAHEARLREIRRRLVELAPIRVELEAHYDNVCYEIQQLCKEKDYIERTYIEVKVITRKHVAERSKAEQKPIDVKNLVNRLDPSQLEEMLKMLTRIQKEQAKEEESEDENESEV